MIKTQIKSTRQKGQYAKKKKTLNNLVRNFDAYVYQMERSDEPKVRRAIELGKQHIPLIEIMKIIDKEFPEE